jgi:hypothetical protein
MTNEQLNSSTYYPHPLWCSDPGGLPQRRWCHITVGWERPSTPPGMLNSWPGLHSPAGLWRIFLNFFFRDPGSCCLLSRDKVRAKWNTYIWVSVWWKTKKLDKNWTVRVPPVRGHRGEHSEYERVVNSCFRFGFELWPGTYSLDPNDSREIQTLQTSLFQRRLQTSRSKQSGSCLRLGVQKYRHHLPCPSVLRVVY